MRRRARGRSARDQRREAGLRPHRLWPTGYTGRLIAEYLATSHRGDDAPSWAIAGRSTDKLQKVRADIGAPDDLPLVKADAAEPASLRSMCERAAVIITTVGPYQLHGPELVSGCAAPGTAYVD